MKAVWTRRIRIWGRRLLREESGQSIAEYVLIMFIVVMIAMKVKSSLKSKIEGLVETTGEKMDDFTRE
ncbi:hypothetical protein EBZ37_11935 [bacterium]|nr:hypothetical protein [bacterium]